MPKNRQDGIFHLRKNGQFVEYGCADNIQQNGKRVINSKSETESTSLARKVETAKRIHQQGRLDEARILWEKLIAKNRDQPDALHFLGVLEFQQGNVEKAKELIQRSIELNPGEAAAYNNLANIRRTTGDLEGAIESYRLAARLAPHDEEIGKNFEMAVQALHRTEEAVKEFREAVALNPAAEEAYKKAFRLMYAQGRSNEIADVFRHWLEQAPDNPTARHMLAASTGEAVPTRASEAYIRETFDGFADNFDASLERLRYRVPQQTADALSRYWSEERAIGAILDAGCGTGLCGPLLKPLAEYLVGVDLSSGMLEKAKQRQVYDQLIESDLTEYLAQRELGFDAIVAADSLIYFGDLEPVFEAGNLALNPSGLFIFSIEKSTHDVAPGFSLTPSGRYAHSEPGIVALAETHGYSVLANQPMIARTERGIPVKGLLFVLRKGT